MTNDEKAHYYDQWKDYFEPLARVRREVMKANNAGTTADELMVDIEVKPELENLIQTMLNEVGDE